MSEGKRRKGKPGAAGPGLAKPGLKAAREKRGLAWTARGMTMGMRIGTWRGGCESCREGGKWGGGGGECELKAGKGERFGGKFWAGTGKKNEKIFGRIGRGRRLETKSLTSCRGEAKSFRLVGGGHSVVDGV